MEQVETELMIWVVERGRWNTTSLGEGAPYCWAEGVGGGGGSCGGVGGEVFEVMDAMGG
jgi:hypothetical protein